MECLQTPVSEGPIEDYPRKSKPGIMLVTQSEQTEVQYCTEVEALSYQVTLTGKCTPEKNQPEHCERKLLV